MTDTTTIIGPSMAQIIATRFLLYSVDQKGNILQYQNTPNDWLNIGGPPRFLQLATDDYLLFLLDESGKVFQFMGEPNQWELVGENMQSLAGGGKMLYGMAAGSGNVMLYEGQPMGWTELGGSVSSIVANGNNLIAISKDGTQVQQYIPDPPEWQTIGKDYSHLFMAPNALYGVGKDGKSLFRYQGKPNTWLQIGEGWNQFSAVGITLFAISIDGSTVGQFSGVPGQWDPFSTDAAGITADEKYVYLTNAQSVRQIDPGLDEAEEQIAEVDSTDPQEKEAMEPLAQSFEVGLGSWAWSLQVLDEAFAAYDGKITMILRQGKGQQNLTLVRTGFGRGQTYHFQMDVSPVFTGLDALSVGGEDNFFGDQRHLGTVTAFNPGDSEVYTFNFNTKIPNDNWITKNVTSVRTAHTAPGVATVFIWNYLGKDVAVGHASIELDDGTYISWWPQGVDRKSMPLLPNIYSVASVPNRTFADDVAGEKGHQPDWRVPVGGLNHNKIRTWWTGFKTSHQWSTLSQNCSTTVADAIWAGGASSILSARETNNWESMVVWVPNDVLSFAQAIDAHLS